MRKIVALAAAAAWLSAGLGACADDDADPGASGDTGGLGGSAGTAGAPTAAGGSSATGTGSGVGGTATAGAGGLAASGGDSVGGAGAGSTGGAAAGGSGGAAGTPMFAVDIYVHHTCDVSTTPASISVPAGSTFTVNWVNSSSSASPVDVAKIDAYNTVPIVLDLGAGESYHDDIREWCGIFTGTFSFRITGCYEPYYLDVDCNE